MASFSVARAEAHDLPLEYNERSMSVHTSIDFGRVW